MNSILSHKQQLINLLDNYDQAVILEYGCGKGDFIELLLSSDKKPKAIYAVDSNEAMLLQVNERFKTFIDQGIVITQLVNDPAELQTKFDKIICHNVLECIGDKLAFINSFKPLLTDDSIFILSHYDFDTAIYHSKFKELTRKLVHHFSDTTQQWMKFSDGQMGRKIPGLVNQSAFKKYAKHETWRLVDTIFEPGYYGHLMADMLIETCKTQVSMDELLAWREDLIQKNHTMEYYFAIDLVVSVISNH